MNRRLQSTAYALLMALATLLAHVPSAYATADGAWQQALLQAKQGQLSQAADMLRGAAATLPEGDPWRARMRSAAELLAMRAAQRTLPEQPLSGAHAALAQRYLSSHPAPEPAETWIAATLATLLPGSGHAWLGRWRDALVVVIMVWPMVGLTIWAARRSMGPVTLFFAMIATWLWSGTVFSAISLARRGSVEQYEAWWRALWQASGLPGAP